MKWQIKCKKRAIKKLEKLDEITHNKIIDKLNNIVNAGDPYCTGKSLKGNFKGYWRYRVGDYRIVCEIKDKEKTILVNNVAHRREAYKTK